MILLAHHPLTEALAFVAPVGVLVIALVALALRERLAPRTGSAQDREEKGR